MTIRLRRVITGNRHRRRTGPSPTSLRPRPMWLPALNHATGTTSLSRSMTAATTGGILPRAAEAICGSSPELPHFLFPACIRVQNVHSPLSRTRPAHTTRRYRENLWQDKDISCHDASLQNFFFAA